MTPALQVTNLVVLFLWENINDYVALNECKIILRYVIYVTYTFCRGRYGAQTNTHLRF